MSCQLAPSDPEVTHDVIILRLAVGVSAQPASQGW